MLVTSPPMDAMLHYRRQITDDALAYYGHRAFQELMERGAKEMIYTIVKDCSTMDPDERNARTFQLDVVVLSRERYTKLIEEAYRQGLQDAR